MALSVGETRYSCTNYQFFSSFFFPTKFGMYVAALRGGKMFESLSDGT